MEEAIKKIRELMALIDPGLDVGPGSPFDREILDYIRRQFGIGELELDIPDMMVRRIAQLDNQISTAEGGAVYEFLIKVLPAIFAVPRLEIQRIKHNQDINNIDDMTDDEVDRRLGNLFISRREGDVAIGRVRAYFSNPIQVTTNLTNRAISRTGLAFFPDGAFTATANLVASQKQDGLFYVDIPYVAEAKGDQYNIGANEIVDIENMPGLVRATNLEAFVGGVPRESNRALVARAKKSLAERSLSSKNSISTILTETFPNKVMSVSSIGFRDPEMQRDSLVYQPSVLRSGIILQVEEVSSKITFDLLYSDVDPSTIVVYVDGILQTVSNYTFGDNAGTDGVDTISFSSAVSGTVTMLYYRESGYLNLIPNIPGSIEAPPLFPHPDQPQKVHIGGKADIYIKASSLETDSIQVRNIDRFTFYKVNDGNITFDSADQSWYVSTSRGIPLNEIGAVVGDIIEYVTLDNIGDPVVKSGNTYTITGIDPLNRRYRVSGGTLTTLTNVDLRFRIKEDRAFPLERLVAVDNFGREIFLDSGGNRATEFNASVNLPLAPSLGYINRDSSLVQFPKTFQTSLPIVASSHATVFATRNSVEIFSDGGKSLGNVRYFVEEENIASSSLTRPWVHIKDVTILNSLSGEPLEDQKVRRIYPADIRSVDVSGGVDSDPNVANSGNKAAGKARIYFEHPLTILLYGAAYAGSVSFNSVVPDRQTRFVHRVTKEVSPGVFTKFNLKYRLLSHGPAGNPAILIRPEDFEEDNGLYYVEVFIEGDHIESEREDMVPVVESDLNIGDGAELFIGDISLSDALEHVVGELEFEFAGDPTPRTLGSGAILETPVDSQHPYLNFLGSWSGETFSSTGTPNFLDNTVSIGDFVKTLIQEESPFLSSVSGVVGPAIKFVSNSIVSSTGSFLGENVFEDTSNPFGSVSVGNRFLVTSGSFVGEYVVIEVISLSKVLLNSTFSAESGVQYQVRYDFISSGVQLGDIVNGLSISPVYVVGFSKINTENDTLVINQSVTLGAGTINIFKWSQYSTHQVLDVLSESSLRLDNPSSGTGVHFVILSQNGSFRLKNPHIRYSDLRLEEGTPGNDGNRSFRAEGYNLDTRNPFDRSLKDSQFTFSVEELTLFRFTEGVDTRYLPNKRPTGSELDLPPASSVNEGRGRDNFTLLCGKRVPIYGPNFELVVGVSTVFTGTFTGTITYGDFATNSVDQKHLRVFSKVNGSLTELKQIPYDSSKLSAFSSPSGSINGQSADLVYMFHKGGGPGGVDRIYFSQDNANNSMGGVAFEYLSRLDEVKIINSSSTDIDLINGTLTVEYPLPASSSEIATFINNNSLELFAVVGEDDAGGNVLEGSYFRSTSPINELGETFTSKQLRGKDIQIDYTWSRTTKEVHEFVTANNSRSIDQDLLVRHGIPVFANVKMSVHSTFASPNDLKKEISDAILVLNVEPLRTSELVRLPKVANYIPIPVDIIGFTILEDRKLKVYRSRDGIEPRRIEVVLPNKIEVNVTS